MARGNVFVTGANGYIGNAVARAFARAGWRVFGLVRKPAAAADLAAAEITPVLGTLDGASLIPKLPALDVIVSCTEQVPGYAAHFDTVLHLVCELAKTSNAHGIRPLVLWTSGCKDYGTTAVHGSPDLAPHTEDSPLHSPPLLRERTASCPRIFQHDSFDAVLLRPTCVYGYSSSYYGGLFDYAAASKDELVVPADENSIMHATHVDDCAEAYVVIAQRPREEVAGQMYNISGERYETVREVCTALAKEYGLKVRFAVEAGSEFPTGLHFVLGFSQWVGSDKIRKLGWRDVRAAFSDDMGVYRKAYEARGGDGVLKKRMEMAAEAAGGQKA